MRGEPYFFKINKYSFLGARTSYGATVLGSPFIKPCGCSFQACHTRPFHGNLISKSACHFFNGYNCQLYEFDQPPTTRLPTIMFVSWVVCRDQHFLRICTQTQTTPISSDMCPPMPTHSMTCTHPCPPMLFKSRPCI